MVARAGRLGSTRRTLVSVVVLTLALLWPTIVSAQVSPLQTRVVVDRTYAAVVRIRVPLGLDHEGRPIVSYGSGTIVSSAGYVLTNYHVVGDRGEGAPSIEVWRQDAGFEPLYHAFDATFVRGDAQLDLAVLRIVSDANGQPVRGEFAFFPIGDFRALGVKLTDPIDAIGFPRAGGSSMTAVPGTVSGFMGEFDRLEPYRLSEEGLHSEVEAVVARIPAGDAWIKTSAPFTGGISGGALLDANGVLIGVPTLTLGALRLARPAILARPLLRDVPGVAYVGDAEHGAVTRGRGDAIEPGQEAEFVRRAQAGGVVVVGSGTFVLDATLDLRNTVEIIGAGQDRTTIQVEDGHFALTWRGDGELRLRDLTVEYTGTHGTVITATAGSLDMRNTTVRGGRAGEWGGYGHGLVLTSNARGRIQDSIVRDNGSDGVVVQNGARLELISNAVVANGGIGILFLYSTGHAEGNVITGNGMAGVQPYNSDVAIHNNTLRDNGDTRRFVFLPPPPGFRYAYHP